MLPCFPSKPFFATAIWPHSTLCVLSQHAPCIANANYNHVGTAVVLGPDL